jgi:hypothetical protein
MRTDATQVYKKRATRNTLNIQQMMQLAELGLCNLNERDKHTDYFFGVEELLQILPSCIVTNEGWLYSLKIYKNAFDVQCVSYSTHKNIKTGESDYLYTIACDELMQQGEMYNGHLVDALFEMLLWVNQNHKTYLADYKEKLHHYMLSM